MNILLLAVGKTDAEYLRTGFAEYEKRLQRYAQFNVTIVSDVKNAKSLPQEQLKQKEGEALLGSIHSSDDVILLDALGKQYTSPQFADILQRKMNAGTKRLVFVIGGAYGFSDAVYNRANGKMSLSLMTFSHQMVRVIFAEQLYRAFTILRGEPYHHE